MYPGAQLFSPLSGIINFYQHRAAKFAIAAEKFIIGVHFVANVSFFDNTFGTYHLLNLITNRQAILKKQCDILSNVYTPWGFRRYDLRPESGTYFFVRYIINDFTSFYGLHFFASPCFSESDC